MSHIDSKVAAVLDNAPRNVDPDDEDALIAALEEDDDDLSGLREQRLQQLHAEFSRAKALRDAGEGAGQYVEIKDEKELMDVTTQTKLVVVHFFKSDFNRCRIMDSHLENLAPKHLDTRFMKISVENAPFLVTKLQIQVLPCVISFIDGISVDRIIGFEGVGGGPGSDNFKSRDLELRLLGCNVLVRSKMVGEDSEFRASKLQRAEKAQQEEEDDDDWD